MCKLFLGKRIIEHVYYLTLCMLLRLMELYSGCLENFIVVKSENFAIIPNIPKIKFNKFYL